VGCPRGAGRAAVRGADGALSVVLSGPARPCRAGRGWAAPRWHSRRLLPALRRPGYVGICDPAERNRAVPPALPADRLAPHHAL